MKSFLIILALGLASSEKLDRTYLPPAGSKFAGGSPGAIQVPLEPPKESYAGRNDGLPTLGDSKVELGISRGILERQGTTPRYERPFSYSQNTYKVPITTTSYAFTQTTTLPPIYESAIGPFPPQTTVGPYENGQDNQNFPGIYVPQKPGIVIGSRKGGYAYQSPVSDNILANNQIPVPGGDIGSPNFQSFDIPRQGLMFFDQQLENIQGPVNIGQQGKPSTTINNAAKPGYDQSYNQQIPSVYQLRQEQLRKQNLIPSTVAPQQTTAGVETQYGNYNAQPVATYEQMIPQVSSYSGQVSNNYGMLGDKQDQPSRQNNPKLYGLINTQGSTPNIGLGTYNNQPTTTYAPTTTSSFASSSGIPSSPPMFSTTTYPDFISTSTSSTTSNQRLTPIRYKPRPERPQAESDRNAVILNYENVLTPEGFSYAFDTSNGIHADKSGTAVDGVKAQGSYSYIGDDGKVYSVSYLADENGFQPKGDHLPTPHPIPEAIQRVIEQAARDKEAGIFDDGSYDEAKYGYKKYQGHRLHNPENSSVQSASYIHPSNRIGTNKPYDEEEYNNKLVSESRNPVNQANDKSLLYNKDVSGRGPQASSKTTLGPQSENYTPQSIDSVTGENYPRVPTYVQNKNVYATKKTPVNEVKNIVGSQQSRRGRPQSSAASNFSDVSSSPASNTNLMSNQPIVFQNRGGQDSFTSIIRPIDEETGYQYDPPQNKFRQETNQFPTRFTEQTTDTMEESVEKDISTIKPFVTPYIYGEDGEEENLDQSGASRNKNPITSLNKYRTQSDSDKFDDSNPDYNEDSTDLISGDDDTSTTISNPEATPVYTSYDYNSPRVNEKEFLRPGQSVFNRYQTDTTSPDYFASTTPMPSANYNDQSPNYKQPIHSGVLGSTSGIPSTTYAPNFDSFGTGLTVDAFGRPISEHNNQGVVNEPYSSMHPSKTGSGSHAGHYTPSSGLNGEGKPDSNRDSFNPSVGRFGKPISVQDPTSITFPDAYQATETVIGEDFSGPKQPQIYDSRTGYHY